MILMVTTEGTHVVVQSNASSPRDSLQTLTDDQVALPLSSIQPDTSTTSSQRPSSTSVSASPSPPKTSSTSSQTTPPHPSHARSSHFTPTPPSQKGAGELGGGFEDYGERREKWEEDAGYQGTVGFVDVGCGEILVGGDGVEVEWVDGYCGRKWEVGKGWESHTKQQVVDIFKSSQ
ncbi:hypothetical protein BC829DRAFT_419744 [Chytridium lagenaria]|nr:hypothetical protein BC829DRAFT_419744 [Chytridium lagenaria]